MNKTQYKMIVLDLDDTLLKCDGTISQKTKRALKKAQKNGVTVVLASGRPSFAMSHIATELELEKYNGYIISYNGARIVQCATNKEIFSIDITKEMLHELYDLSKQFGGYIQTYVGDKIVASEANPYTDIEKSITGMEVVIAENFKEYVQQDVVKSIVLQDPAVLSDIEKLMQQHVEGRMYMTISKPFFLEFMNIAVDKNKSVQRLCTYLHILPQQVIAVGDSYNDLSMISGAGLGVAMSNAVESVKKVAKYITDDNENDGVAKVVHRFILDC